MSCKIAQLKPLQNLFCALHLEPRCHSRVTIPCLHKLQNAEGGVLGSFGAVIGYCQALFQNGTHPSIHTEKVLKQLEGLPWSRSHEIFYGYKPSELSPDEFIKLALEPLRKEGRVPVLITSLEVGKDDEEIVKIFSSVRHHSSTETILVRLLVSDLRKANAFLTSLFESASQAKEYPSFWPLFQYTGEETNIAHAFGRYWSYTCWAINPFTPGKIIQSLEGQTVVAQFVVGTKEGITLEHVMLPKEMKITGANASLYNLAAYLEQISHLPYWPTMIILGPSMSEWDDAYNRARVEKFTTLLLEKVQPYWNFVPNERRKKVLELAY